MKRIICGIFLIIFSLISIFAFSSRSLDGRALVAPEGTLPKGDFGRALGFLPGDLVIVTNHATGISIEVQVFATCDPADGVAIVLSPEAAEKLRIKRGSSAYVKIQKKQVLPYEKSISTSSGEDTKSTLESDPDRNPTVTLKENQKNEATETSEVVEAEQIEEVPEEMPIAVPLEPIAEVATETSEVVEAEQIEEVPEEMPIAVPLEPIAEVATETSEVVEAEQIEEVPEEMPIAVPLEPIAEIPTETTEVVEAEQIEEVPEEMPIVVPLEPIAEVANGDIILFESDADQYEEYQKIIDNINDNQELISDILIEVPEELATEEGQQELFSENNIEVEENPIIFDEPEVILSEEFIPTIEEPTEEFPEFVVLDDIEEEIEIVILESEIPENIVETEEESFVGEGPIVDSEEVTEQIASTEEIPPQEEIPEVVDLLPYEDETENKNEIITEDIPEYIELEPIETIVEVIPEEVSETKEDESFALEGPVVSVEEVPEEVEIAEVVPTEVVPEEVEIAEVVPVEVVPEEVEIAEAVPVEVVPEEVEIAEVPPVEEVAPENLEIPMHVELPILNEEINITYDNLLENAPVEEVTPIEIVKQEIPEVKELPKEDFVKSEIVSEVKDYNQKAKELSSSEDFEKGKYYIQIATYSKKSNVDNVVNTYGNNYPMNVIKLDNGGYQVLIGPLSVDEYLIVLERFKLRNFKDAFIRRR